MVPAAGDGQGTISRQVPAGVTRTQSITEMRGVYQRAFGPATLAESRGPPGEAG